MNELQKMYLKIETIKSTLEERIINNAKRSLEAIDQYGMDAKKLVCMGVKGAPKTDPLRSFIASIQEYNKFQEGQNGDVLSSFQFQHFAWIYSLAQREIFKDCNENKETLISLASFSNSNVFDAFNKQSSEEQTRIKEDVFTSIKIIDLLAKNLQENFESPSILEKQLTSINEIISEDKTIITEKHTKLENYFTEQQKNNPIENKQVQVEEKYKKENNHQDYAKKMLDISMYFFRSLAPKQNIPSNNSSETQLNLK